MLDGILPATVRQLAQGLRSELHVRPSIVREAATRPSVGADSVSRTASASTGVDELGTTRAEHALGLRRAKLARPG